MSYLLKALEKAELERKQNNVSPDVAPSTVVVSKGLPMPVVAVLLAVTLLLFWKLIPETENTSEVDRSLVQKTDVSEPKSKQETSKAVLVATELVQPEIAPVTASQQEFGEGDVMVPPQNEIKQLEQLSKAVLQAIPSLQLESHIYSSAESFRSVVINGRSFKQGQFITQDVILEKITEDGIVIEVASQLIALPKGISWVASNAQ